ncbi:hypothetical protein lerEdw1_012273 [Lerista edwardsae]|nr:hypothetical protein lerEdw1_012273 [Lerista edwardsae]
MVFSVLVAFVASANLVSTFNFRFYLPNVQFPACAYLQIKVPTNSYYSAFKPGGLWKAVQFIAKGSLERTVQLAAPLFITDVQARLFCRSRFLPQQFKNFPRPAASDSTYTGHTRGWRNDLLTGEGEGLTGADK